MFFVIIILAVMLLYVWLVYPALVMGLGRQKIAAHSAPPTAKTDEFPVIAILFSAHNEEAVIRQRLENLAALDYPADLMRVYVGVDGGTDRTAEIARDWAAGHPNVNVIVSEQNHGKAAMLKRLVREVSEFRVQGSGCRIEKCETGVEIPEPRPLNAYCPLLVFTDANTMFSSDALTKMVDWFGDVNVGGVCGRLVFVERKKSEVRSQKVEAGKWEAGGGTDEAVYWDMETRLKEAESALDSCLGANGAIYAIRGGLFPRDIPDNTIVDDFVIGMKVREQGFRMVYEGKAVAVEELPETVDDEWRRRVRIGAGAYQSLLLCWRCLLPRYGVFAWAFWSHKVLRWLTPHLGVLLVVSGGWLLVDWVRSVSVGAVNLAGIGLAIVLVLGLMVFRGSRWGRKVFKLLSYFMVMQAALFVGFLRFCRGNLRGTWERTER